MNDELLSQLIFDVDVELGLAADDSHKRKEILKHFARLVASIEYETWCAEVEDRNPKYAPDLDLEGDPIQEELPFYD